MDRSLFSSPKKFPKPCTNYELEVEKKFLSFFSLFRAALWYMAVPRLGVKYKLQLQAYPPATATLDPSCICTVHHNCGNAMSLTH